MNAPRLQNLRAEPLRWRLRSVARHEARRHGSYDPAGVGHAEDSMSLLYPQRDNLTTAELTAGN